MPSFLQSPRVSSQVCCVSEDLKMTKTSRKQKCSRAWICFNINCPRFDVKDLSSKMASSCVEFKIELCQYETNLLINLVKYRIWENTCVLKLLVSIVAAVMPVGE